MMNYKNLLAYGIVLIFCIAIIASPIIQACEEQESESDCSNKPNNHSSFSFLPSGNILDKLFERYPLLNQILEMIINLIYNWLTKLGYQSSL